MSVPGLKNGIEIPEKCCMLTRMKIPIILSFLAIGPFFCAIPTASAQTAGSALSIVEKEKGVSFVSSLIEIKGQRGEPQPPAWIFRFNDPASRGGLREIVVQGNQILSERTPVRGFGGTGDLPTIAIASVNVDTRAVFNIANQSAIRHGVGFHWLDYSLRPDVQTSQPVWHLTFIDVFGARVGDMTLDGRTLKLIEPLRVDPGAPTIQQSNRPGQPTTSSPEQNDEISSGGAIGSAVDFIWRTRRSVHNAVFGSIGAAQEWLTGKRTIGTPDPE
jgi:hypothetical protein